RFSTPSHPRSLDFPLPDRTVRQSFFHFFIPRISAWNVRFSSRDPPDAVFLSIDPACFPLSHLFSFSRMRRMRLMAIFLRCVSFSRAPGHHYVVQVAPKLFSYKG